MPVFGKIFEKFIYKSLFEYLDGHKLLSEHQSGFIPNDSCTISYCLLFMTCMSFDANPTPEVRGVFLDMSKAFDKVWYEGLIYKLRQVRIFGEALALINSFLNNRFQHVILNGQ